MVANIDLYSNSSNDAKHIRHRKCIKVYSSDNVVKGASRPKSEHYRPINRDKISPFERAEYDEYARMPKSERLATMQILKDQVDTYRSESVRLHSDFIMADNPFVKAGLVEKIETCKKTIAQIVSKLKFMARLR
jgi:hypothetical protein